MGLQKSYQENDENDLPDSFHFNPLVMWGYTRVAVDYNVFINVFVDMILWQIRRRGVRRQPEGHGERDDDERQGEEEDGVANVALGIWTWHFFVKVSLDWNTFKVV